MNKLVDMLTDSNSVIACNACRELCELSEANSMCYSYFDRFAALLSHKNSLVRNRAIALIAANAKWDKDNKINNIICEILLHITDEKPITSRQFIKVLPEIAKQKPQFSMQIITALKTADVSVYSESMRPLIKKDIQSAMIKINSFSDKEKWSI